jgi:hypothetical protein
MAELFSLLPLLLALGLGAMALYALGYNWLAWRGGAERSPIFLIAPLFSLLAVGALNQFLQPPDHRLWLIALLAALLDPSSYLLLRTARDASKAD